MTSAMRPSIPAATAHTAGSNSAANARTSSSGRAPATMRANLTQAAIIAVAVSTLLSAQDTTPAIRVDVSLVNVAFTARDARGQIVTDLTRDEIEVFEDGVTQPVRFFSQSSDLPLRFALIVDVSDSQSSFN